MRPGREQRLGSLMRRLAAQFLNREVADKLIITVNRAEVIDRGQRAKIYVTVFPDEAERAGWRELKRLRWPLQQFLQKQIPLKRVPFFSLVIDEEEKLRRNRAVEL